MKTPVAFIIFNRPDTTARVFESIRQAKPSKLLVVADGARQGKVGEAEKCAVTRAIIDGVDWECEVLTNYSDVNLGCGKRVSSGLNWVFQQVEEAIILEDDCLPDSTFFQYCEELLIKYKNHEKVMHIGGYNPTPKSNNQESLTFSRLVPIWGWATWQRAWNHYDFKMDLWVEYEKKNDLQYFKSQQYNVAKTMERFYQGKFDSWDGQWAFACLVMNGISIIPNINLIQNIGFRSDATHTTKENIKLGLLSSTLRFPLIEPDSMIPDRLFDEKYLIVLNGDHRKFKLARRIFNYCKSQIYKK